MKRSIATLLSLTVLLSLFACKREKQPTTQQDSQLIVFAAASLTESLNAIEKSYNQKHPEIHFQFNFDSSGTLKTQLESAADCDIFISAAEKQMNALDRNKGEGSADIIDPETRLDLLENKVTLAVSKTDLDIHDFSDLNTARVKTIGLGNEDVPVGAYSKELFQSLGIWDDIQAKVSYGSNVKEVTTWLSEGAVDCGVIYETDAAAAGLKVVARADDKLIKTPIIYPAAILKNSHNRDAAKAFLDYLQGDEASQIFTEHGFAIPKRAN